MHSSLEFRNVDPNDTSSDIGMFTKTGIKEGDLLIRVPNEVMIQSPDKRPLNCDLAFKLIEEIKKKDTSDYAPYIEYLLQTQPPGQLPSTWSDAGKEMLMKALGDEQFNIKRFEIMAKKYGTFEENNILPPVDPVSWIHNEWYHDCNGGHDDVDEYAAMIVLQRAWDNLFIPIYDMLNHRNGQWLNTRTDNDGVHKSRSVSILASRDIEAGEQIYSSYNMCEDCKARISSYGTSDIFRDYGFIEKMPQTWFFGETGFRMDELSDSNEDGSPQYDIYEWIDDDLPTEEDIEMFQKTLEYVELRVGMVEDREAWSNVPDNEWEKTVEYMRSMELALQTVLQWHERMLYQNSCVIDGTCSVSFNRYRDLDDEYITELEHHYQDQTCDFQFHVFEDGTYTEIDSFQSQYQKISFTYNHLDRDTCMDLDDTVQICDSYRPHYHEYMVHQTARFLPKDSIKRVLFVGGGDSMLLYEILKYPSLELVVGLELDQKVPRGCFKYHGTQPHFDDDRVEWWFGDAAKSLLMLPKNYFASFDLVLVDLSETVMSFTVSEQLNVLEALTLLVKPDGIFVKNEVYFETFKEMFPYSAQITWYDNPIICSQVMVMGSRTVDFMNPNGLILTEHGTEKLIVQDLKDIHDNFELYHDYAFNATSINICDNLKDTGLHKNQIRSPGITMIAEIEEVSKSLTAVGVKESITNAIEREGLTFKASDAIQMDSNILAYVIMKEGYVVARAMTDKKYVGLDIHFWSSMHMQKSVMNAIVDAIGGSSSTLSSYRVITGGMFGIDSWEEDEKLRGPQFQELCDDIKNTTLFVAAHDGEASDADMKTAIKQGLALMGRKDLKMLMLVGNDMNDKQMSEARQAALSDLDSVSTLLSLNCPSMVGFNRYAEDSGKSLAACEKHLYDAIIEESRNKLFDVILIDSTAEKLTSSILLEVLSHTPLHEIIRDDSMVMSTSMHNEKELWRKNLLLLIKDTIFLDDAEAAFADISFVNSETDGEFHIMVVNYGAENFENNLNSTVVDFNVKEGNKLSSRVNILHGGNWRFQENFKPSRMFKANDYNQTGPLTQWISQVPTGHQAIVQLEPNLSLKKQQGISKNLLSTAINNAVKAIGFSLKSVKSFCDIGDGCLFVSLQDAGTLTVQWDGRTHIDIVLFTYDEDVGAVDRFVANFLEVIPTYTTMLRDEQPRGIGRVVSYQRDLQDKTLPRWAPRN